MVAVVRHSRWRELCCGVAITGSRQHPELFASCEWELKFAGILWQRKLRQKVRAGPLGSALGAGHLALWLKRWRCGHNKLEADAVDTADVWAIA